jgi:hypothetical protein
LKRTLSWLAQLSMLLLAGVIGGIVGRMHSSASTVHAQEKDVTGCMVFVPKAWGEYKGGSSYGLAFQDQSGTLRFLAHPICGNGLSPIQAPVVDLKVERR